MSEEDGHQTNDNRCGGHQHRPDTLQSGLEHERSDFRDAVWMLVAECILQEAENDHTSVVGYAPIPLKYG